MIELLLTSAIAAPQFSAQTESYFSLSQPFEQRTLVQWKWKEDGWRTDLRILHQLVGEQNHISLQAWDLRYQYLWNNIRIRIGNQTIRWGQLDLLSDLDSLNGKDLRYGPTIAPEWARIPSPSLQIHLPFQPLLLTIQWLPFSAKDTLTWMGEPWGVFSTSDINNLMDSAQTWSGDWLTEDWMKGFLRAAQQQLTSSTSISLPEPEMLDYGDIAVRFGFENFDLSSHLYASWMRSRRPKTRLHENIVTYLQEERLPTSLELDQLNAIVEQPIDISYPRQLLLGADLSTTLFLFGFRAELSYINSRVRPLPYMQSATRPYMSGAMALDYNFDQSVISLETKAFRFFDPVTTPWLEANQTIQTAILGNLSLSNSTNLILSGQYDWLLGDGFGQAILHHRLSSRWAIALQGIMLHGPNEENPMTYSSGIFGLWREYDQVSLRIQWTP